MARVKWWGQAAFWIEGADGTRIVTDPYTPEALGYAPITDEADVVIRSSHDDSAHCRSDLIGGDPAVIDALQVALGNEDGKARGIEVTAILAEEYEGHPEHAPNQNGMYRWEMDGIRFAHMGDVGNALTAEQIAFFEGTDVLLALAGGELVIDLPDLMEMIGRAKPKLVIPMHFRTLTYRPRNSLWIESFLSHWDDRDVDFAFGCEAEITAAGLPESTRVLVMDYAR